MTGRHRMLEADGVTVGTELLGAVALGLGLVVSMVSDEVSAKSAPTAYSVPGKEPRAAALSAPDRPHRHHYRCAQS
ncbi:hypothetical protein E4K10_12470 [Streptomyces sp. T1317-0309]|nr:hypothetical protein E4K10_12470 [Streptomyces sp. T1317-0309]